MIKVKELVAINKYPEPLVLAVDLNLVKTKKEEREKSLMITDDDYKRGRGQICGQRYSTLAE